MKLFVARGHQRDRPPEGSALIDAGTDPDRISAVAPGSGLDEALDGVGGFVDETFRFSVS
jgi:hypothetical protein